MNDVRFRAAMKEAGFSVVMFTYEAHAFGSWYAVVRRDPLMLRLVFDGRDSVLEIRERPNGGDWGAAWSTLRHQKVSSKDEAQVLNLCKVLLNET
jgi:hypothetical protein